MIFFLVLALIIFAPGNTFAYSGLLMFHDCGPGRKAALVQRLFYYWLLWAFFCCCLSPNFMISFFGNPIRMEGWIFWLVVSRLGWLYWAKFENLNSLAVYSFGLCVGFVLFNFFIGKNSASCAMISGVAAITFVLTWQLDRWIAVGVMLPIILGAGNRSALIAAIAGVFVKSLWDIKSILGKRMFIIGFAIAAILPFTPMGKKINSFSFSSVGSGARSFWIRQSWELSKHLPLSGYGLDSIVNFLSNPASGPMIPTKAADRTHNIAYDMILMTGWFGYILSLLVLGAAVGTAVKFPNRINVSCLSVLVAWIVAGLMNPQGAGAHAMMAICLFGFNEKEFL